MRDRLRQARGEVLGEALAAATVDRTVLARIAGPIGEAARTAASELAALGEHERRALRARWSASARSPIPAGLRGIDASWIEAALAALPTKAREALAAGAADPASVWLVRRACAGFPPMPAIDVSLARPRVPADVVVLTPAALRTWLDDIGADQLAYALGARADEIVTARRAARSPSDALATDAVEERLARATARVGHAPRAGQLGDRRAAIERAKGPLDEVALIRIGARAVSVHLAPLDRRRLVLRFPHALGAVLAEDLAAYRTADRGPAWAALA